MWDWIPKEERDLMAGVFALEDGRKRRAQESRTEMRKLAKRTDFREPAQPYIHTGVHVPEEEPQIIVRQQPTDDAPERILEGQMYGEPLRERFPDLKNH